MSDKSMKLAFRAALCSMITKQTGRRIADPDPKVKLDDLGFDEVDRSIVALILEDDFKIDIPEGDEFEWTTLGDVFAPLDAKFDATCALLGYVDAVFVDPSLLDASVTEPAAIAEATSATLSQLDALSKAGKLGVVK